MRLPRVLRLTRIVNNRFLNRWLEAHARELSLRIRLGSPAAVELLERLERANAHPSQANIDSLMVYLDEFRKGLLN